jgi:hypothetical protein
LWRILWRMNLSLQVLTFLSRAKRPEKCISSALPAVKRSLRLAEICAACTKRTGAAFRFSAGFCSKPDISALDVSESSAGMSAPNGPKHGGKKQVPEGFKILKEGDVEILQHGNDVFYNKTQVGSCDRSGYHPCRNLLMSVALSMSIEVTSGALYLDDCLDARV